MKRVAPPAGGVSPPAQAQRICANRSGAKRSRSIVRTLLDWSSPFPSSGRKIPQSDAGGAFVLDLLRRVDALEPRERDAGAVEPRAERPSDETGTHSLSFVLVDGSRLSYKTEYLELAGRLWRKYKPHFLQVVNVNHLDEATSNHPTYFTRDGFAFIGCDKIITLSDSRIIKFSTDAGVHKIQKTVFRKFDQPICVIACNEVTRSKRPIFDHLLEQVRGFNRWLIMGRFDYAKLALCGNFDVLECGQMHCIAFGLSPFYILTTSCSHGVFEVGMDTSDVSQPAVDVPVEQDADAPSTQALHQRFGLLRRGAPVLVSLSQAVLQKTMYSGPKFGVGAVPSFQFFESVVRSCLLCVATMG